MFLSEQWRTVEGYEGIYEVSSEGRIRNGEGYILRPWTNPGGYQQIGLSRDGKKRQHLVHRLVCRAFYGDHPKEKPLALHGSKGIRDNSVSNLRWGSNSENMKDRQRDGTDPGRNKVMCPQGHLYDQTAYEYGKRKHRACRACRAERAKVNRVTALPPGDKRHGTVYGYSGFSCRCEKCKLAYSEYGRRWRRGKP